MRTYQPSWIALRDSKDTPKQIKIAAANKLHRRIYKAIIKEKDMDTVYKYQLSENAQRARLSRTSKSGMLIITLTLGIGLTDF